MEEKLMAKNKPYYQHLKSSEDLVTTYEAIRAGFVALALEKSRRAAPYIEEARALKVAASKARTPQDLLNLKEIWPGLLTAAGVSDKAFKYLGPDDQIKAIEGLIKNFLEPAGPNFVEELVFRFLLTRGDTLGGSMRNIGGALAQRKLTRAILATLSVAGKTYRWLPTADDSECKNLGLGGPWIEMTDDGTGIDLHLRGLSWQDKNRRRTLIYNLWVPLVKNNVDFCLFNAGSNDFQLPASRKEVLNSPRSYIALGELKGGIDPAGADEHWKTANSALERIREAFTGSKFKPRLFFIGAAIAKRMAEEIWQQLNAGKLDNAANLTNDDQIASVAHWLCSL
jgi:hypothetical protein